MSDASCPEDRFSPATLHQLLFQTMAQGVVFQDANGQIVGANPAAEQILGLTLNQLRGRTSLDPRWRAVREDGSELPGDLHPAMVALRSGRAVSRTLMGIFHPTAEQLRWIEVEATPLMVGGARPAGVYTVFSDVTDRRQVESAAQRTEVLFRAIIEEIPHPVFLKDPYGRYQVINAAGARALGRSRSEIIGLTNSDLVPVDIAVKWDALDQRVLRGETLTYEAVSPEGEIFQMTKFPHRDEGGSVVGLVGVAHNLTPLKRLQFQLTDSQKFEAVGRLAGGIAHDFGNLLTVILGFSVGLLERDDIPPDVRDDIADINRAGERGADLTEQLLLLSRNRTVRMKAIDVAKAVQDVERLLQRALGEDIELLVSMRSPLPDVELGNGQLEQILLNLATNARDAMPAGGELFVTIDTVTVSGREMADRPSLRPGEYVRFEVRDTGFGIEADALARLFEPFFTTKGGEGTGLGLATTHAILTQHGGDIWAESTVGKGTTFTFVLPVKPSVTKDVEIQHHEAAGGRGERVLLVEDDPDVRRLLATALERSGYLPTPCGGLGEALIAIRRAEFDLVVTDIVMPAGSGPDLVKRILSHDASVKVLFMSGFAEPKHRAAIDRHPFLQKPFPATTFVAKVREVLDSQPPQQGATGEVS